MKLRARALALAYRALHPTKLAPVRETEHWSPSADGGTFVRHDYLYQDPASGRLRQLGVDTWVADGTPDAMREELRRMALNCIRREIDTQCGSAHVPLPLSFPHSGVKARLV